MTNLNFTTMKKAFLAYVNGKITKDELHRYQVLQKTLMGENSFVLVEDTPEWKEFNTLTGKIL
jgi:hypothetical protein